MAGNSIRVAIASGDGKFVGRHFGHADKFYIADVRADGFDAVEVRCCAPVCNMGGHGENGAAAVLEILSDCSCVLAAKIGPGMQAFLKSRGLASYELAGLIPDSLSELFRRERERP